MPPATLKKRLQKEAVLVTGLLFVGLVLMPIAIYYVGQGIFGDYSESGYRGFFGTISEKVRSGDLVAWFLILSPYLGWQILRLLALAWRATRS